MEIKDCKRCGDTWCFYGSGRPIRCGKCKSPYWDKERVNGSGSSVGRASSATPLPRIATPVKRQEKKVDGSIPAPSTEPVQWFPNSKCPHGYMNSFVCEKNNGGCRRL